MGFLDEADKGIHEFSRDYGYSIPRNLSKAVKEKLTEDELDTYLKISEKVTQKAFLTQTKGTLCNTCAEKIEDEILGFPRYRAAKTCNICGDKNKLQYYKIKGD